MRIAGFLIVLIAFLTSWRPATASAQTVVIASIVPVRIVYVVDDHVSKVVTNSALSVSPTFHTDTDHLIQPTQELWRQYSQLLASYGTFLPGRMYFSNSLSQSPPWSESVARESALVALCLTAGLSIQRLYHINI